jgi:hypothetical protein
MPTATERSVRRLAVVLCAAVAAAFLVLSVLVALAFGYRHFDAFAYGEWSRLIAQTGDLYAGSNAVLLHRPLFYVLQGELWRAFGFDVWIGRLFSLSFAIGLAGALYVLARARGRDALDGWLAVTVLLASSVFATYAFAGLTDVPAAALVAATGAAVLSGQPSRGRAAFAVGFAALAVLAKPTVLTPLVALAAAAALGPAEELRRRLALRSAPVLGGLALGLLWDVTQARRLDLSLREFVSSGVEGFWADRADAARGDTILGMDWLGPGLRALLVFALVYGIARVLAARHDVAAWAAAGVAWVWWFAGPALAAGSFSVYPWAHASVLSLVAQLALVALLFAAPLAPPEDAPARLWCAQLVVWAVPGAVVWLLYRPDDARLLGAAWPPLVLLMAASFGTVMAGLGRLRPALALVPVGVIAVLALANLASLDGIPRSTWGEIRAAGWLGFVDHDRFAGVGHSPFDDEVAAVRANAPDDDRIRSTDSRLGFFFPGRVETSYPTACGDLGRERVLVLLQGDEARELMLRAGGSSDPTAWLSCPAPRVYAVREQLGEYDVLVVGAPPSPAPTPADCGITLGGGEGLDATFGRDLSLAAARRLRARAAKGGYASSRIERTGCNEFKVVVTGVGGDLDDYRREAASIGLHPEFGPPERGVEVSPEPMLP